MLCLIFNILIFSLSLNCESTEFIYDKIEQKDVDKDQGLIKSFNLKNKFNCLNKCNQENQCVLVSWNRNICKLFDKSSVKSFFQSNSSRIFAKKILSNKN